MKRDWHKLISQSEYEITLEEDVWVTMRDGIRLAVDIYRPKADGKFPALLAFGEYGKEQQKLPNNPVYQPADFIRGNGGGQCQWYYVPRGYVQVIPDMRGMGKSEGSMGQSYDGYDLVEWIAKQPWCNGNVGMLGLCGYGLGQYDVASQQPSHLKAIFPFDAPTDMYRYGLYHGGLFNYIIRVRWSPMPLRSAGGPEHMNPAASFKEFSNDEIQIRIREVQKNPDVMCNNHLYVATVCPERFPGLLDGLLHPYDGPYYGEPTRYTKLNSIKIPVYSGARWNG